MVLFKFQKTHDDQLYTQYTNKPFFLCPKSSFNTRITSPFKLENENEIMEECKQMFGIDDFKLVYNAQKCVFVINKKMSKRKFTTDYDIHAKIFVDKIIYNKSINYIEISIEKIVMLSPADLI